jgi:prepilin-type N-terminal cleavage/methylation domain-containing protein
LKKGYTLVEIVVVMGIITVLSIGVTVAIRAVRRNSIETTNRGNAQTINVALKALYQKKGVYCVPSTDTSLNTKCMGEIACSTVASQLKSDNVLTSDLSSTPTYSGGCKLLPLDKYTYEIRIYDYDGWATNPGEIGAIKSQ